MSKMFVVCLILLRLMTWLKATLFLASLFIGLHCIFFDSFNGNLLHLFTCRIILYAIALADYDQDKMEASQGILKTKDGIDRLALYHSSIGRLVHQLS